MNCKNCLANCGSKGNDREVACSGYRPMTNAEKIRKKSDEELAAWLEGLVQIVVASGENPFDQTWLEWLKEEVKDG